MFNITECSIIRAPSGVWTYVGRVPAELGYFVPATKSAVMGGRAIKTQSGDLIEWKSRIFDHKQEAIDWAARCNIHVNA